MFHTFFPLTNPARVSNIISTGIVGNPTVVSHFFPLTNLAIGSKIICTGIVGNTTDVSHFFSSHKSSHSFKKYLHWDYWKSNHCFTLFFALTNLAIVSKIICTGIVGNPTVVSTFFPLTNPARVSNIISTGIVGNPTVLSHFFSSHKSSHRFKNYFHWDCWKYNRCFTLFFLSQI